MIALPEPNFKTHLTFPTAWNKIHAEGSEPMPERAVTCCFTGHRASKLPWGFDETDPRCAALKRRIYDSAEAVYSSGVRHFICGMANGCDMFFGEAVLALRGKVPGVTLEAAVPFGGQADNWPPPLRARYDRLLAECDYRTLVSQAYTPDCMQRRNHYMCDCSAVLIAAYDGQKGGTMSTLLYAMRQGLEIIEIMI